MSARPTALSSPTFSAATNSSFDIVSLSEASLTPSSNEDSDDEIVWSVSSAPASKSSFSPASEDDDYVVLNTRSSPIRGSVSPAVDPHTPHPGDLVVSMNNLSMSDGEHSQHSKPRRYHSKQASPILKQRKKGTRSAESPQPSPPKALVAKPIHTGLGSRPVVDDLSETLDSVSISDDESVVSTMYEEAVKYINSFLSNPTHDSVSTLIFLQSLIIELGLATSTMPSSLTSAKAVLRSNAFLNIRDYLAVRGEGLAAIKEVMYPSKSALIRDIRRRKNTAPLRFVKRTGLQVLLVSCYH